VVNGATCCTSIGLGLLLLQGVWMIPITVQLIDMHFRYNIEYNTEIDRSIVLSINRSMSFCPLSPPSLFSQLDLCHLNLLSITVKKVCHGHDSQA